MENNPPPIIGGQPPLSPAASGSSVRQLLAVVLSVFLGLFVTAAFFSLADDSLIVFLNLHLLSAIRQLVGLFAMLAASAVYVLMAVTPMIPKRLFLPLALFNLAVLLLGTAVAIYQDARLPGVGWGFSVCQVARGLGILYCVQGGLKLCWPLMPVERLGLRGFSWANLCVFVLANLFGLLPAVLAFFLFFTTVAVDHFSNGFMAVHPGGLTVQMRKYVRNDGKTIELFPMAHVADADFYQEISQAFPTNAVILMEGVSDEHNLLTNAISYKRMAKALGLAEQHESFAPGGDQTVVRADVDISIFTTNTLDLLNLVMLIHARGLNPGLVQKLAFYPEPPELLDTLLDDLVRKRNQHLLEQLNEQLLQTGSIIVVPWGVAHIPGISKEIQKEGFHLAETHDYTVIRFHGGGKQNRTTGP